MNKMIKLIGLAASLAAIGSVAQAKDKSPLSKVYAVQEMEYSYQQGSANEGRLEQARYDQDRAIRAAEVLKSDASLDLKRFAVDELVSIKNSIATQALLGAYRQAQETRDPDVAAYAAKAVWMHAAQLQFKNAQANKLIGEMTKSPYQQVRAVGRLAQHDAKSFALRNAN